LPIQQETRGNETNKKTIQAQEQERFWETINYIQKTEDNHWASAEPHCKHTNEKQPHQY